jgi:hypothetical protein
VLTEFHVFYREIQAALLFASPAGSGNHALEGVIFDISTEINLVASDGQGLIRLESRPEFAPEPTGRAKFILSSDIVRRIPRHVVYGAISVKYNPETHRVTIQSPEMPMIEASAVEEIFPKWRSIIPDGEPEPACDAFISGKAVERFIRAGRLLQPRRRPIGLHFRFFGRDRPIEVTLMGNPNLWGYFMRHRDRIP